MDDASLDDFAGGSDASDDAEGSGKDTDAEGDPGEEDAGAVDPATVEPATATYAWSGEAVACAACGEPVERRWRDDAGMVCGACKEW